MRAPLCFIDKGTVLQLTTHKKEEVIHHYPEQLCTVLLWTIHLRGPMNSNSASKVSPTEPPAPHHSRGLRFLYRHPPFNLSLICASNKSGSVKSMPQMSFYFQSTFDICRKASRVSGDKQLELLVQVAVKEVGVPWANPCNTHKHTHITTYIFGLNN